MIDETSNSELLFREGPGQFFRVGHIPVYSEWRRHLFGQGDNGVTWRPLKGCEPNWFWRWMQHICFGCRWVKD